MDLPPEEQVVEWLKTLKFQKIRTEDRIFVKSDQSSPPGWDEFVKSPAARDLDLKLSIKFSVVKNVKSITLEGKNTLEWYKRKGGDFPGDRGYLPGKSI